MQPASILSSMLVTAGFGATNSTPVPPELVYLFSVHATEAPPLFVGNGGHGNRLFIPITGGSFQGPKFQGKVLNAGGDWGSYDAAGKVFAPDAKIVIETDDGAKILLSGRGKSPYISYEFETGSEKYAWLNDAIGVGLVNVGNDEITADIFQVVTVPTPKPSSP